MLGRTELEHADWQPDEVVIRVDGMKSTLRLSIEDGCCERKAKKVRKNEREKSSLREDNLSGESRVACATPHNLQVNATSLVLLRSCQPRAVSLQTIILASLP